jgi:hypothetical protein
VVVVVDRFSVSMAEGFAMALSGLGRTRIVGTRMARLGAAVGRIELPYSKIAVQISTEPVYAIDGTPRWEIEPDVVVNPLRGADGNDPFIAAAIEELKRRLPPRAERAAAGQVLDNYGRLTLAQNWFKTGWTPFVSGHPKGTITNNGTATGTSPGFVSEAGQDYHLTAASQAVDAGTVLNPAVLPDDNVVRE